VAFLYVFDLLELNGVDGRPLALAERKDSCSSSSKVALPASSSNDHIEGDGAEIFAHDIKMDSGAEAPQCA
jgi:ATP-dependent DNA ligase